MAERRFLAVLCGLWLLANPAGAAVPGDAVQDPSAVEVRHAVIGTVADLLKPEAEAAELIERRLAMGTMRGSRNDRQRVPFALTRPPGPTPELLRGTEKLNHVTVPSNSAYSAARSLVGLVGGRPIAAKRRGRPSNDLARMTLVTCLAVAFEFGTGETRRAYRAPNQPGGGRFVSMVSEVMHLCGAGRSGAARLVHDYINDRDDKPRNRVGRKPVRKGCT